MSVPQGRHGYVSIGGTLYPVFNWSMPSPRNLVPGMPVGSSWGVHVAEGAQSTRFIANIQFREKATEVLATAFWDRFTSRPFSSGFDQTVGSTIIAASGMRTYTLANAKAEAFTITGAFGQPIGLQVVFLAPGIPTKANYVPADYSKSADTSPLLMFDRVSFGGVTGNIYGFEMTFANNHVPDAPLNGTKFLSAWDAGALTAGLSLTVKEHANGGEPYSDGGTPSVVLTNGVTSRTFAYSAVTANNPNDIGVGVGQVYKTHNGLCMGTASNPPLVIT